MDTTITALEQRLANAASPIEKVDVIADLAEHLAPHNLERAIDLTQGAHLYLSRHAPNDLERIARTLNDLGAYLRQKAEYADAMGHLLEAVQIAQLLEHRGYEARAYNTIATIYFDLGNYPESLEHYYQALNLSEEADDAERQAGILNDLGLLHITLDQPTEGLPFLDRSLAICREHGFHQIEAAALDSLGQAHFCLGDYEQSLLYAQECRVLAQRAYLIRSEIEASITMGKTYVALGQLNQALARFQDAMTIAREDGRRAFEVISLIQVGKVYLQKKDQSRALARLGIALNIAQELGQPQLLCDIHEVLAAIYAQTGSYKNALDHYEQFQTLKEELFNNQADHRLKSLLVKHQVEQAQREAEIYQLKNVELQQIIDEKERLIADLDAFSSMVAHDLKSPISSLAAYAELIKRDKESVLSEDAASFVEEIAQTGYKMGRVIDDLLLLAGVRRKTIEIGPLDMPAILHDIERRLAHLIAEREAMIFMPDEWPAIEGYAGWVEEVWANYISNAVKYGGDPPVLQVGATPLPDGMIRCWVQDNGDGIAPDAQTSLFDEFTRLAQRRDSHGLGLSIIKRIIEKLGGEVGVESSGTPGAGSLFYFTLPAATEPAEPASTPPANNGHRHKNGTRHPKAETV